MEAKDKAKKKPLVRRIILAALAVLALAVLAVAARYAYIMFIDPMSAFDAPGTAAPTRTSLLTPAPAEQTPTTAPVPSETPQAAETPLPTETVTPADDLSYMENRVNILFLGWDQSPEREDETSELFRDEDNNYRSDVLMLLTVDFEAETVDLISIPRDSYAPLYNADGEWVYTKSHYKINAAFAKGGSAESSRGFKYAMNTVSTLLGVPIDYYAGVDMEGLKAVVDAIGGVDYDVDVRIVLNGRVLEKGYQHLNGQQVLDYCRARKGISTDAGRNDRQQRMLFAIFEKLRSNGQLANIAKIYRSVKGYVYTNLNTDQMAALAAVGMDMNMNDLKRHSVPGEYCSDTPYSNAGYYLIDNTGLRELIRSIFGIVIPVNPRYDIGYVMADIAADEAQEYIEMADYLLTHDAVRALADESGLINAPSAELVALTVAREELYALTHRAENEDVDVSFDTSAITEGETAVINAMSGLCTRLSLTREDVSRSRLPDEIYDALPERRNQTDEETDGE